MKRNNKQPISFDEEDIDESSIMGNKAKSSVWGGAGLSDYAESTMARSTHSPKLDDDVILLMESDSSNANNHLLANNNNEKKSVLSKSSNTKKSSLTSRFSSMIDSLVSRVSRSASSLLNQHSPNINDILDGTADPQRPPQRQPPQQQQDQEESSSSTVVGVGVNVNGVHIINSTIPETSTADNATTADKDVEEVFALREEVDMLKKRILELENNEKEHESSSFETSAHYNTAPHIMESNSSASSATANNNDTITDIPTIQSIDKLQPHQISRYSRQLLLNDGFGVAGQKQLLSSSILVVGAGGIGSSVLLYLAAAGIGHITIVDYDSVEMTNLHRQVIHKDENASKSYNDQVGMNKAASAKLAMLELNPTMSVTALNSMISSQNALELVNKHDVIVDACDNPQTRYVLNDACILANKTLVSGSAMGTEGQLTVYNYNTPINNTTTNVDSSSNEADATTMSSADEQEKKEQQQQQQHRKSACYRCLYPNPVPSEGCKSCSDNGVLGMVPGIIGMFQAVEVIKIITGIGTVMHDRLLMYDSLQCSFLNVKKPPARAKCAVCSSNTNETTRTIKTMEDSARSLECVRGPSVCAVPSTSMPQRLSADNNNNNNISCVQYNETVRKANTPHILLDVRVPRQYDMCSLDGSINLPLEELQSKFDVVDELSNNGVLPIYCLCRRGIASAEATRILIDKANENGDTKVEGSSADGNRKVYNIEGGLSAWVQTVDSEFPQY